MDKLMNQWEHLIPHDVIDIIAPASGSTPTKMDQGVAWLKEHHLFPRFPENIINTDLFFAAPLSEQWQHFRVALYSDAKVIWCLRGGYGSMRLIPLLEKLSPPKKPKLLIGFSDITSLHLYLNQKWNWPSLHGRTISQLHPDWKNHDESKLLVDVLFGRVPEVEFKDLKALNPAAQENITIKSSVIGGNLRLIQSSLGTSWEVNPKGRILFLEDVSERGYSVDRMLEQLYQANILDQGLDALIFGDFTEGLEKNGEDLVPLALKRFAERVNYPVLVGMPCGHAHGMNSPLPMNTPATLSLGGSPSLICQTNA